MHKEKSQYAKNILQDNAEVVVPFGRSRKSKSFKSDSKIKCIKIIKKCEGITLNTNALKKGGEQQNQIVVQDVKYLWSCSSFRA